MPSGSATPIWTCSATRAPKCRTTARPICGSGRASRRVREYIRHGVTVGIGTDGSASSDNQNMFEAMRAAAFASRVRGLPPADWVSTAEAFTMATEGSARVLGMGDFIGKIAKGYKADLV